MSDTDRITFECADCGEPLAADNFDPSNNVKIIVCRCCGRKFGTQAEIHQAMIQLGKNEIDKMIDKANLVMLDNIR